MMIFDSLLAPHQEVDNIIPIRLFRKLMLIKLIGNIGYKNIRKTEKGSLSQNLKYLHQGPIVH
jgi:hypothetical protein